MHANNEANITILRDLRQRIVDKRDAERRQKRRRLYLTAGAIITLALLAAAVAPCQMGSADMSKMQQEAARRYYQGEGR